MKVQRKQAKPYNGEPLPWRMAEHMRTHPEFELPVLLANWPICEAVQWQGHGKEGKTVEETALLRKVRPIADGHAHAHLLRARGVDPDTHGHITDSSGHKLLVRPGGVLIDYPRSSRAGFEMGGITYHDDPDVLRVYDVKL